MPSPDIFFRFKRILSAIIHINSTSIALDEENDYYRLVEMFKKLGYLEKRHTDHWGYSSYYLTKLGHSEMQILKDDTLYPNIYDLMAMPENKRDSWIRILTGLASFEESKIHPNEMDIMTYGDEE